MESILFLVVVICVFSFITKKIGDLNFNKQKTPLVGYKKKSRIMNDSESALFFELKRQLPPDYYIFPNMRLGDIVDATNGVGFYKRRNKILPKHIDFIICDSLFKPLVAIELNGNSHNRLDRMKSDEEKRRILEEVNLPLVKLRVGDDFNHSSSVIIESYFKTQNI